MKRAFKILGFLVIFLGIYLYACLVFTPKSRKDFGGDKYYSGYGYEAETKNTIDVLAIGNSDLYSSLISQQLFGDYGIAIYSCAAGKATLGMGERWLKDASKNHKLKLLIIEADFIFETRYRGSIEQLLGRFRFLGSPFVYHAKWKQMKAKDFYQLPKTEMDDLKGYRFSDKIKEIKKDPSNYMKPHKKSTITSKNMIRLKRILEFCSDHNIQVLMYESPTFSSWNLTKSNLVQEVCDKYNIPFIDFNLLLDEINFDAKRDYRDNGNHLNYFGATKVTTYLGEYLNSHYKLTNHFNDPAYDKWRESYNIYLKKVDKYLKKIEASTV